MTDTPEVTATIATRVKELRGRQGLTAQQIADRLSAQGVPWNRFTVLSLENGKRQNVAVVELMALARVLHVAPIHLMISPSNEGACQITPEEAQPSSMARAWVRGDQALPGTDERIFRTEVPIDELGVRRETTR